jgi:hypothetical protein
LEVRIEVVVAEVVVAEVEEADLDVVVAAEAEGGADDVIQT